MGLLIGCAFASMLGIAIGIGEKNMPLQGFSWLALGIVSMAIMMEVS